MGSGAGTASAVFAARVAESDHVGLKTKKRVRPVEGEPFADRRAEIAAVHRVALVAEKPGHERMKAVRDEPQASRTMVGRIGKGKARN